MYGLWLYKELKTEYGHCKVEVFRKGYTASAVEIGGFVGNSLNLALENLDTITAPIGKSICSFSIYDTDQVEYDDLFTPDATAYKVVVSTKVDGGAYVTRWSGYITPDFFAENLSYRTPISISARDNIGYLNDVDFDLTATTVTIRQLITSAFAKIAEDYPMSLVFETTKQTAEGILAIDATISTVLLQEKSWYEVLETILHDLGMQMRWVDNNTIAVFDVSQLSEKFSMQRFNFIENSGYREILPAWRELSQKQDYGLRENFFEGRIKEDNLTFVKEEKVTIDGYSADFTNLRYYSINNWVGNGLTIKYSDYFFTIGGAISESEKNRIYFTGIDKNTTAYADKYIGWRQRVHKSTNAMKVTFKALNSIQIASSNVFTGVPFLQTFGPYAPGTAQFGLKANLLLHSGAKTYVMRYNWEELTNENEAMNFVLPELSGNATEDECTIDVGNIPYDGELELRIYGWYFISATNWTSMPLNAVSYITDVVYSYDGSVTGQSAKVTVAELHNVKEGRDYSFGQVPLDCGGINAYAGGLYNANGDELVGFKRNADGTTYPLLELVGREIIHFNKRNYTKLSGTVKNLSNEPLGFNKLLVYNGKNYLPFACSLDVISNTMNVTTMQEVEPYATHSFVEIKSELVTGGGATVSGGNNTALQYSAEVGNAKRISELNNASESEKKESYIIVDNASWNESKKVPLSEMEGLNEAELTEFLTANEYATQPWVSGIAKGLADDIANRVLIADFEKLVYAVDGNYKSISNIASAIPTIESNLSALATRVGGAESVITNIQATYVDKASAQEINGVKTFKNGLKIGDAELVWDSTNKALKIVGSAYITEDLSFGGYQAPGGGGTSGGGIVTIKVNGQEYTSQNGIVTLPNYPSLAGYATESWVGANYLGLGGGTITTSSVYGLGISSTASSGESGIMLGNNGTTKGLLLTGADWGVALVNTVRTYNSLGIKDDGTPYFTSFGNGTYTLYHTGNFNPNNYLPLSGGTITGPLKLTDSLELAYSSTALSIITSYGQSWFGMMNDSFCHIYTNAPAFYMDKPLYVDNGNAVIHSGNIGSQSVSYASSAGNADTLDGYHADSLAFYNGDIKTFGGAPQFGYGYTSNGWATAGPAMTFGSGQYYLQFQYVYNATSEPCIRTHCPELGYSNWQYLAYLTSNVASATKLQTARSIWGQSFDGTGNVDGKIYQEGKWILGCHTDGNLYIGFDTYSTNDTLIYGRNLYFGTYSGHSMLINSSGNVIMGTTSDNGAKLQVEGNVTAYGSITSKAAAGFYHWSADGGTLYSYIGHDYNGGYTWLYNGISGGAVVLYDAGGINLTQSTTINGNLTVTGDITFGSDARYKNKITDVEIDLATIANAPLFIYKWNDREDDREHLGTTAQYWFDTAFKNAVIPTNDEKLWTMSYGEIAIGNTIILAREQIRVKSRVEMLEEKVKQLETKLNEYRRVA